MTCCSFSSFPYRKSPIEQKQATEYKSGSNLHWKSQKKLKNLVLCCSALTDAEKVKKFRELSLSLRILFHCVNQKK